MFRWLRRKRIKTAHLEQVTNPKRQNNLEIASEIKKLNQKYQQFSSAYWGDFKKLLLATDVGSETALHLLTLTQRKVKKSEADPAKIKNILKKIIIDEYNKTTTPQHINFQLNQLNVFLMVGVNGVGKTTSIAKIAYHYLQQGQKILLIAADTFRAGAVQQLKIWADRLNVDIVTPLKPNQDPASVVYRGLEKAQQEKYDLVFIDTAGRLHNKVNLMAELAKINKTIEKVIHKAPDETLLIIDALVGQNGLNQAEVFSRSVKVTGIILTKTDSTAKGGIVLRINHHFHIPVKMIGNGEHLENLHLFNIETYAHNILGL